MTADAPDTIVVGVDGTENDPDTLALAAQLSRGRKARVVIVHAHGYGRLEGLLGEGEHRAALRALAEEISASSARLQGLDVTMRLVADTSPPRALHAVAAEEGAALLVVGASRRGRVGIITPGSVSERVIQGSPCPVAIPPRGHADRAGEIATVGCAYDDGEPARAALAVAVELARAAGARLELIGVAESILTSSLVATAPVDAAEIDARLRAELLAALDRAARGIGDVDAAAVLLDGSPVERLAERSGELDLLVTGSRGYGPLRSVLLGGVSGALIRAARCPVVVCPRVEAPAADDG